MRLPKQPALQSDCEANAHALWDWYLDLLLYARMHDSDALAVERSIRLLIAESEICLLQSDANETSAFDRRNAWLAHFESLLGSVLDRLDRVEEAKQSLGSAVGRAPALDEHRMNYIQFLLARGYVQDAVHQYLLLSPAATEDADHHRTIGRWMKAYPAFEPQIRLALTGERTSIETEHTA